MTWRVDIFPSQDGAVHLRVTGHRSVALVHPFDSTVFGCFSCTGLASLLPNLSLTISCFFEDIVKVF